MTLSRRNRATLAAVTRVLVPDGTAIGFSADDLDLVQKVTDEVDGYPPRAQRRIRLLLLGTEHYPLLSGHRRRFSRLGPREQKKFLASMGRHKRSPLRRLVVSYLKGLVYANYLSQPEIEAAVGYRYECARPRAGVDAAPEEQIHH
ncbi:MAG: hypothetical protein ACRDKJ_06175 [Actinomycetota bacterium]